ncbi:MAG: hypothetical protein FJ349_01235 [Sphingomonadales bacterium]|nr:hypothetical protein [Sphingomonadales bacterium]
MRLTLLLSLLLFTQVLFAQKFALIENKGENASYFDYSNPNSFVSVLLNNIDYIPTLIDQNGYQGVYDAYMLDYMGVDPEEMLAVTTSTRLLLYNAEENVETMVVKTTQTLNTFLDSVKDIPAYESLAQIDDQKLQQFWDNSCENCAVRIFSKFYFDIRNTDAILIEDRANERWVHLVGKLSDGRHMVTLGLRASQLNDNACFRFLQYINTDDCSQLFADYKKQANYQVESDICRKWQRGEAFDFTALVNIYDVLNEPTCWNSVTASGLQLMGVTDAGKIGHLQQITELDTLTKEFTIQQERGDVMYFYSFIDEDTVYLIKNSGDFRAAYHIFVNETDFANYVYADSIWLLNWWETANMGDTLRTLPQKITYWKERPEVNAAFYYKIDTDLFNVPKAYVSDLLFYTQAQNGDKQIFLSYNYQQARDQEEFYGAILKVLNSAIQKQETYLNPSLNWNAFLVQPTQKQSFEHLQKKLQLINTNLSY